MECGSCKLWMDNIDNIIKHLQNQECSFKCFKCGFNFIGFNGETKNKKCWGCLKIPSHNDLEKIDDIFKKKPKYKIKYKRNVVIDLKGSMKGSFMVTDKLFQTIISKDKSSDQAKIFLNHNIDYINWSKGYFCSGCFESLIENKLIKHLWSSNN
jgi:predicted dithiol-disulfide oxidoreductase (DUF899 family)